jgi:SMC interacting uncharacterized protein involved in chromosome segregation
MNPPSSHHGLPINASGQSQQQQHYHSILSDPVTIRDAQLSFLSSQLRQETKKHNDFLSAFLDSERRLSSEVNNNILLHKVIYELRSEVHHREMNVREIEAKLIEAQRKLQDIKTHNEEVARGASVCGCGQVRSYQSTPSLEF